MDLGLTGRACIVTGGSSGIGLAVARRLREEGAYVLLCGRSSERLRAAAGQLGDEGLSWHALDVTAPDAGERLAGICQESFGRLDVLVNGAGATMVRAIDELTDDDWQAQWELHVMAPMRLMRACVPAMVAQGWGRVVNVSSSSGKRPGQRNVAYSVTKAAQLSLSRAYADVFARQGVLINAVAPGPVAGDLWLGPGGLLDQSVRAGAGSREEVLAAARQRCRSAGWPRPTRSPA
jgi:3-oxoacyl-[acyl-carrier protein] reductase